ncbi:MAG: two-component regulator propeller domain-containing protein [Pirellulaceae bacterium]
MSTCVTHGTKRRQHAWIVLSLIMALSTCAFGQDQSPPVKSASKTGDNDQKAAAAKGENVTELDKAIFYILQAKDNTYWFGSNDRGVYRYDGETLVNFTTDDGLVSNRIRGIQEDKAGNIYFATYEGITKFDGQAFVTLNAPADADAKEWKLQPDDLWFVGPPDAGVVFRYDGKLLHRLEFPKTKDGDEHYRQMPRDKFPNAKYSPYDVYTIFKDRKGNVWFGTATLGACRFDGRSFVWLSENELRNGSFGTRSIIEDKEGRFWFCSPLHRFDVDLSDPAGPKFRKLDGLRDTNDPNIEPFGGIMSSTVDSAGALWMATYGGGVWQYDGKSITHYPVKDGDKTITVFSIHQDNQGIFWLGTQEAEVYKFNGKTFEKFRPLFGISSHALK